MKKTNKAGILFILLAIATTLIANDQATYTITGTKDPRLDAWFLAKYVSYSSAEECTSKNTFTGGRRFALGGRSIKIEDVNYTIKFPLKVTGENNDCDYRFRGLELIMKRLYDEERSSIHPILSDRQEVSPIYWKTKGGGRCSFNILTPPPTYEPIKNISVLRKSRHFCVKRFGFQKISPEQNGIRKHIVDFTVLCRLITI